MNSSNAIAEMKLISDAVLDSLETPFGPTLYNPLAAVTLCNVALSLMSLQGDIATAKVILAEFILAAENGYRLEA